MGRAFRKYSTNYIKVSEDSKSMTNQEAIGILMTKRI